MDASNRIYAGTDDQGIFVSTNAGVSWTPANRGVWGGYVTDYYSLSGNQVLCVTDGGIHISSNGGQIWQQVNNGLSSLSAFCVIMNSLGEVLVGTGSGVFRRKQFLTVAPMPPSLLFPVDSSISVPLKIVISWNPSLTTDSYNIQIAKDQKFLQVAFEQSNILTTSLQVDSLSRMTQYYWRVCGTNSEGKGGWSNTRRFTTILPAITPPTLLSPSNRALAVVINPTLSWSRVIPSSAYAVQVDRDSGFSTIVFENHSIIDTSVNVSTLQSGTMYFWRVRTVRSDSVSVWSLPWQFTTDFTPPLDHFPLTIGNSWSIVSWYMSTPLSYTLKRVEMDTVLSDGKTYSAIRNYTRPANETSWTTQNWEYLRLEGSRLYEFPDSLIVDFDLTVGGCLPRGCIISDYRDSWLGRFSRILDISANYNPGSGYDWWSYVDSMGYGIMEESSFYNYYPVYTIGARINGVEYGSVFPVAVHDKDFLSPPTHFILYQNYPNPFNPVTTISFSLPIKSFVSLKIFDIMGRKVATIVSEELSAGTYSRQWNASNMSSGIYFYQLQAGSFIQTKKLILLR